jgi:hypothetical protein
MSFRSRPCGCGSGRWDWELLDGRGIYLRRVCDSCVSRVRKEYRPEIFRHYTENDVCERIEPED